MIYVQSTYASSSIKCICRLSESIKNYLELSDVISNRVSWMLNYRLCNNRLQCRLIRLNNLHVNTIAKFLFLFSIISHQQAVCFDTTAVRELSGLQ